MNFQHDFEVEANKVKIGTTITINAWGNFDTKTIECVGIENAIYYANGQLTSNLEEHTDKNEMLFDFFCSGCFDNLYDHVYSGLMC